MKRAFGTLKRMMSIALATVMVSMTVLPPIDVFGAVKSYDNGIRFDAEYYASLYPELVAIIGNDETALLNHYLLIGIMEGRTAYEGQSAEEIANLMIVFSQQAAAAAASVPATPAAPVLPAVSTEAVPAEAASTEAVSGEQTVPVADAQIVPAEKQTSNGLVLVYMNGTDLETNGGAGSRAITNMITASAAGNTRFVILAGGTKTWTDPVLQDANNGAIVSYVIENGTIRKLDSYEEGKDGENYLTSGMVTAFVKDTMEKYSANHTSMYFWDHGGGAAGGYGVNETAGGAMSAAAVAEGIRNAGVKFESVGFDTCLMGSLEVASNFADLADYYVGSQENESNVGWDYRNFSDYGTSDFKDFGKQFIKGYDKWNEEQKPEDLESLTLSVLDLSKVPKAQQQWNDFLTTYGSNAVGIQQILAARAAAREFSYGKAADARHEEVDLLDFISQFGSEQAQDLRESLKEVVLYKNANKLEGVNGLSVFIPGQNVYLFSDSHDKVAANNMSESAMKTLDKIASVFAGQKSPTLFGENWSDQKHLGDQDVYKNQKWYDEEYAKLGSNDSFSFTQVKNGGFAVESQLGLTADQLLSSDLRVMLKNDTGYINLGRIDNFCKTRDSKSPVFNYNGQWLHINGIPVMLYQYDEFNAVEDGHHCKDYYTMATVNNEPKKIRIQWDATEKSWSLLGYIKGDADFNGRVLETQLKAGDKVQFLYDMASSDGTPYGENGRSGWGDPFTYDPDKISLATQVLAQPDMDVVFHGTITDVYGKTYSTPYFKMEEGSNKVTIEDVNSGDFIIEKSDSSAIKEEWEISDDNFLTCAYDPATNSYNSYDEITDAFNIILVDSGSITHFNDNKKFGFRYDPTAKKFFIIDAAGEITELGFTAEELAAFAAKTGRDYADFLQMLNLVISISEKGEYTDEDNRLLASLYSEFDNLLDNIAGGYVDEDDPDYEIFRILVEIGAFEDDDDDDQSSSGDSGYIDEDADYDGDTWGSDDEASDGGDEGGADESDDGDWED